MQYSRVRQLGQKSEQPLEQRSNMIKRIVIIVIVLVIASMKITGLESHHEELCQEYLQETTFMPIEDIIEICQP